MPTPRPLRIGLTGGIGSGKSTVAGMLGTLGARVIDTDAIARELTGPGGRALELIVQDFGRDAVDGTGALDRERMRAQVFGDASARRRLEAILHPLIAQQALAEAAAAGPRPVVFDVPLLAESRHWRGRVDRVLVVDCETATQVQRVVARSGWAPQAAQRVVDQQASRVQRRAIADAVIFNQGLALEALALEVQTLWRLWQVAR